MNKKNQTNIDVLNFNNSPENQVNLFFDNSYDSIFYANEKNKLLKVNNAFIKLFQYSLEEVQKMQIEDFFINKLQVKLFYKILVTSNRVDDFEVLMKNKQNQKIYCTISVLRSANNNNNNQEINLRGVIRNVTNEIAAKKALQESEQWLRAIFENAPIGIIIINSQGVILQSNIFFNKMIELTVDELKNVNIFDLINIDEKQKFLNMISNIFSERNSQSATNYKIVNHKNKILSARFSNAFLSELEDKGNTLLLLVEDISLKEDVEIENQKLQELLSQREKMEVTSHFAKSFTHDFNNLLTIINGYLDLILTTEKGNMKIYPMLKEMDMAARKATNMVEKLRSISKKSGFVKQQINLNEMVIGIIELFKGSLDEKYRVYAQFNSDWSDILGDEDQLSNVFLNIIINAKEAMPVGGELYIKTENVFLDSQYLSTKQLDIPPGVYIKISIKDTGHGMDKKVKKKIFEPYFSTKGSGGERGLGLTIVYLNIQNHGGFLEVKSTLGKGTEFMMYFPFVNLDSKKFKLSITESMKKPINSIEGMKLLLIDDDEMISTFMETILEFTGYSTIISHNPIEALEIYSNKLDEINLILLDLNMPIMNGWETLSKLRSINNDVKVIIISGSFNVSGYDPIFEENIFARIEKPFAKEQLYRCLDDFRLCVNYNKD